jgi:hypothetical protein
MKFTSLEIKSGESRKLCLFASTVGLTMQNLYDENEDEEYRQALRDTSFQMCRLLELEGIPLNRTPLTAEWLDSNERKDYRRKEAIKY